MSGIDISISSHSGHFLTCQVETSESLEGVFRGGLINRGKNVKKDSIHCINCQGHQSFLEPDE